jgi:N-methylhydantoinase B
VANTHDSVEAAKSLYGVTVGDANATVAERERRRLERIGGKPSGKKLDGKIELQATENLAVRGGRWCCAKCATDLGSVKENYKKGCVRVDRPIQSSNPIVGDPARFIDPTPQFRQFCCPGCGLLIENEIAVAEEPVLVDVELD